MFKKGFTLAETLITLTVLGVLAAITIPGLISDTQNKEFTTAKNLFYNSSNGSGRLAEAARQMALNGDMKTYDSTADFLTAFDKYIKITNTCPNDALEDCFAFPLYNGTSELVAADINNADGKTFGHASSTKEILGARLANGSNILLVQDPDCALGDIYSNDKDEIEKSVKCMSMLVDINGNKKPNKVGEDILNVNVTLPLIPGLTVDTADITFGPIDTTQAPDNAYVSSLAPGGFVNDYWAGAKKACDEKSPAGTWELPDTSEIAKMYEKQSEIGGFDNTKMYWTNEEANNSQASVFMFDLGIETTATYGHDAPVARCVKK